MKIVTAAEMREVDRLTIERGVPGLILMENAGSRVVDFLVETFAPLAEQDVVVVCGKGNNGGDGFVMARQLFTRRLCRSLAVVELFSPDTLTGDASTNRRMLEVCGCPVAREMPATPPTLVIDAILGTGLRGRPEGPSLDAIRLVNAYRRSTVVAVDIPSGLPSDGEKPEGEFVRADYTVTFTAQKRTQALSPGYEQVGKLRVYPIGSPEELLTGHRLNLTTEADLGQLFAKRAANSNKGLYGHVLVVGGSYGKSGAPAMAALAAYRSGAGLVTVAVPPSALAVVAAYRPELMTEALDFNTPIARMAEKMTVLAVGPGLGTEAATVRFVKSVYAEAELPAVVDADALNAIAGDVPHCGNKIRILTPHPGEMGRLSGKSTQEVQADRLGTAQEFAQQTGAVVVLKGDRTVVAFPDGESWINPTGSPAMATGGTGDILTGMIAGLLAQHPPKPGVDHWKRAVVAAVWLHGRCGELASESLGEQCTLATDLLGELPRAMHELRVV